MITLDLPSNSRKDVYQSIWVVLLTLGQVDGQIEHALLEEIFQLGLHIFLVEDKYFAFFLDGAGDDVKDAPLAQNVHDRREGLQRGISDEFVVNVVDR